MKKLGALIISLLLIVGMFAGCGGGKDKGVPVELGFTKDDVEAVIPINASMDTMDDPAFKIVMNDADLDKIFEAIGKVQYDPESDMGDAMMNEDQANMTMFMFIMKDGSLEIFAYGEDGKSQVVMLGLGEADIVYQAYGENPSGIVEGLNDDTEQALEEGLDLMGPLMALGEL